MKYLYLIAFLLLSSLTFSNLLPDFNKIKFGMTTKQIASIETNKIDTIDNNLLKYTISSNITIQYFFYNNKLYWIAYTMDASNYLICYNELVKLYGEQNKSEVISYRTNLIINNRKTRIDLINPSQYQYKLWYFDEKLYKKQKLNNKINGGLE